MEARGAPSLLFPFIKWSQDAEGSGANGHPPCAEERISLLTWVLPETTGPVSASCDLSCKMSDSEGWENN